VTNLTLDNLTLSYGNNNERAVKGLNLQIASGQLVTLLGPSGCGKTSTLKMIAGLIQPDNGDIRFDERSVLKVAPERRKAAMVFQNHLLFPYMNIRQNIAFGLKMQGMSSAVRNSRVDDIMQRVHLQKLGERKPHQISGGQRQRAALARALVTEPDLLLLDEPLSSLDVHLRDDIRQLILELQRASGTTTIMVTHDQHEALLVSDKIALMLDGSLQQFDTPAHLFDKPADEVCARFFGSKNFIQGKVKNNLFYCPLGTLIIDPVLNANSANLSQCLATFRPENLQLDPPNEHSNRFKVSIEYINFLGTHREFGAQVLSQAGTENSPHGDTIKLHVHCHAKELRDYRVGDTLTIGIPPESIWTMPN